MTKALYALLQICDSNFPSGSFSHSFGFETYIQEQVIVDKVTFLKALKIYVQKQLVYIDGLACRLVYEVLERGDMDLIQEWDRQLFVSCLAKETRDGNRRIGERMARLCGELYPSEPLKDYVVAIRRKEAYGHSACVFAIVAHHLNVSKEEAIGTYLFTMISSMVQNAVRGVPLGQTDGQKILVEIQPEIEKTVQRVLELSEEDFGAVSLGLELAQIRHERLPVRLFMS